MHCWGNLFHYTVGLPVDSLFPGSDKPGVSPPATSRRSTLGGKHCMLAYCVSYWSLVHKNCYGYNSVVTLTNLLITWVGQLLLADFGDTPLWGGPSTVFLFCVIFVSTNTDTHHQWSWPF